MWYDVLPCRLASDDEKCVDMAAEITGIPGTPSALVVTVQGIPGGTPVPVTPAGGTGDVNIVEYGGVATSLGQKVMASSIPVTLASNQSPLPVAVSAGTDRTATGTITAAQNVEINTQASGACGVQVSGVWTGTLVFEATIDSAIWNPVLAVNSVTGSEVTSTTVNGNWVIACAGFQKVRVRGNTVTSGTATVFLDASTCPQVVTIGGPIPAGSATIGAVEIRDGADQLDINVAGQAAIQNPPNLDVALSTRASQATLASVLAQFDVALSTRASAANQTNGTQQTKITDGVDVALVTAAGALMVDASSTIQPVSGTVTANQGTAAAVAGAWPTKITDGVDTALVTAAGALQVDGSAVTQPVSGTVTANIGTTGGLALDATLTGGAQTTRITDGVDTANVTAAGALQVDGSAVTQPISAAALPLPAGASTAANQTTLGSQTTKINDGTNTAAVKAAATTPVVADPALVVTISPNSPTQPVSGTVTANQGTAAAVAGGWPVKITDGVDTALVTAAGALVVDGSASTQPVSGTVTANQGTSPWVENLSQVGGNAVTTHAAGEQLVAVEGRAASGAAPVGNPVLSGGTDGAAARSLLTDTSGRQQVVGAAADGAAVAGNPVLVAGQDGTNAQSIFTDTSGRPRVVGAAADGAAVTGDPVLIAGQDGTNAQSLLTDTSGRPNIVGAAADGAAVVGNPVLIAGQDGTNAQSLLTDTSGRPNIVGAAADGAAVAGNPVLIAGQDGTNAQSLLTDTSGRPNIVGAAAQGAAVAGNPVLLGGEDAGGLTQRLQTTALPPVNSEPGLVVRQVVSQTGTTTSVATSTANATLLAANTGRLGAIITNDSTHIMYVKCGATASSTSFSKQLGAGEDWTIPFGYTGIIDGILNAGTGNARITEFV